MVGGGARVQHEEAEQPLRVEREQEQAREQQVRRVQLDRHVVAQIDHHDVHERAGRREQSGRHGAPVEQQQSRPIVSIAPEKN